jgi:hypothetical protein
MVNVKINERPKKPYKVSMKQKLVLWKNKQDWQIPGKSDQMRIETIQIVKSEMQNRN